MKLKELKSIVEEREQLKSEILEIRNSERNKLIERDRILLAEIKKAEFFSKISNEFSFLETEYPFFSKEAVTSIKEKLAKIQEIEKVIRDNISTFDIQFTDLKKYVESYFDVKYGLSVNIQASNVHIVYDMYDTRATDFDLTIEIEGTNYQVANVDIERTNGEKIIPSVIMIHAMDICMTAANSIQYTRRLISLMESWYTITHRLGVRGQITMYSLVMSANLLIVMLFCSIFFGSPK